MLQGDVQQLTESEVEEESIGSIEGGDNWQPIGTNIPADTAYCQVGSTNGGDDNISNCTSSVSSTLQKNL